MEDRNEWLKRIYLRAQGLLTEPEFERRIDAFLRDDQRGKWRLDDISGYYWLLYALVDVVRPKKVVELGRCLGTSALFMLGALPEGSTLITVDTTERGSDLAHCLGDPRLQIILGNDLDLGIYRGIDITKID